MYRSILVPLAMEDGSEDSINDAVLLAERVAAQDAQITLLHVMEQVPGYVTNYLPGDYLVDLRRGVQNRLTALAGRIPKAEGRVIQGHPARSILDWITQHQVDLVIVASHRPGMRDLLIGSTAARVVRHAPCSVHVLR